VSNKKYKALVLLVLDKYYGSQMVLNVSAMIYIYQQEIGIGLLTSAY
jgi:hypothetical protein